MCAAYLGDESAAKAVLAGGMAFIGTVTSMLLVIGNLEACAGRRAAARYLCLRRCLSLRWGLRALSTPDGQATRRSLSWRVIDATLCPAGHCAKIHYTVGAAHRPGLKEFEAPAHRT